MTEVHQQCQLKPGDGKVSGHLSDVAWRKRRNHLGVHQHQIINDKVGNQSVDMVPAIEDPESFLSVDDVTARLKF